ncbi:hypothetical protein TNCV_789921 [Trichonephila clavipes]|nr:hypothetical protein TNCV_789921 [Trichonephila clavipes]
MGFGNENLSVNHRGVVFQPPTMTTSERQHGRVKPRNPLAQEVMVTRSCINEEELNHSGRNKSFQLDQMSVKKLFGSTPHWQLRI